MLLKESAPYWLQHYRGARPPVKKSLHAGTGQFELMLHIQAPR
jgi:hypothetical protein